MVQKDNMENKEITLLLQKKLDWFCFEAKDEEINVEEIDAIINLMDKLKPLPEDDFFNASISYIRFKEKYINRPVSKRGPKVQELIGQLSGDTRRPRHVANAMSGLYRNRAFRRCVAGAAAVLIMFAGMNLGTYATAQKGFFDYITLTGSGQRFFVNIEEDGFDEEREMVRFEYNSVEELEAQYDDLLFPHNLPEEMSFLQANMAQMSNQDILDIRYVCPAGKGTYLNFYIHKFYKTGWIKFENTEMDFICTKMVDGKEVHFYSVGDFIKAYYFYGAAMYLIEGNVTMDGLIDYINNMK